MNKTIQNQISALINQAKCKDRGRFIAAFNRLKGGDADEKVWKQLERACLNSADEVVNKKQGMPHIHYPDLPISEKVEEIKSILETHQVVIVAGETGSGKSTQLPKICMDMGFGAKGLIGHTQPRRLAARSIASRLSEETGMALGEGIGFKIRFNDKTSKGSFIKLMTDGILLAEIKEDKYLSDYEVIIIDEAHERSLNIDFLLGHLKQILPKRPDLKLIITSATIDHRRFSKHFCHVDTKTKKIVNTPIVEVSGRTYPVEIRHVDPLEFEQDLALPERLLRAIDMLSGEKPGDILVFLATERDIHEATDFLKKANLRHSEILPLFARLSNAEQDKIFHPQGGMRRIILSTNVAETSLTVPGIRYVIDSGDVRISRYSYRTKVQRLPIEPISQASANQRAGRCGRVASGICIRLYSLEDFQSRPAFTDPEILRTNLASVILQMESLKLGNIDRFPFLDKPDSRFIKDGYALLHEIGAIEQLKHHHIKVTANGQKIARFPVDPRLARMLLTANELKVLAPMLVIVSFLSIQDPRERPLQFQQKADEAHKADRDKNSDFIGIINLWRRYRQDVANLTNRQRKDYEKKHFLSSIRMREWREIYHQLVDVAKTLKWSPPGSIAEIHDDRLHQAVVSGLLSHIGFNRDAKEYLGARGLKFFIFPGSSQFSKTPKWICAAEIVETTKLYGRMVAKIDPAWLEALASHLIKKHHSDPYWSKKRGAVMASERVSLYGLDIVAQRPVNYEHIDARLSRELFIRHALVYGEFETTAAFYSHNLALLEDVEVLEHKSRRRDIVIDDDTLYQYYEDLIPDHICSGVGFEKWYKNLNQNAQQALFFEKKSLMQHEAAHITSEAYPDYFILDKLKLPLSYHFDPTADDDGVTVKIPLMLIDQMDAAAFEWLVPGMLKDKIVALMRALPKNIRRACVPIPHYATAIMESMEYDVSKRFRDIFLKQLTRITAMAIDETIWDSLELEPHFHMRFEIIDGKRKVIADGRDFKVLRLELKDRPKPEVKAVEAKNEVIYQSWQFKDLALTRDRKEYGITVTVYPCLVDKADGVSLSSATTLPEAQRLNKAAIRRLLMLESASLDRTLKDAIKPKSELNLLFSMIKQPDWQAELIALSYNLAFDLDDDKMIRTKKEYETRRNVGKSRLVPEIENLSALCYDILKQYKQVKDRLKQKKLPLDLLSLYQAVAEVVDSLVYHNFLLQTPISWLKRIRVYLAAQESRLEKGARDVKKDRLYRLEVEALNALLSAKITQKGMSLQNREVSHIHWLIMELWISYYAQNIKTIEPVSVKRIKKHIAEL
ncbi:MAG: ATP-dependent RNA helicase HrpA [Francisellaceae bacterium]